MPPRYDSDEFDDDTDDSSPPWRSRLITWGMAAVALGLGFLIPYTIYLNNQVTQRFGELRWQIPTRVYARPLVLSPGVAMNAATLKTELAASGYRDDGTGSSPGTYRVQGGSFRISSRGYIDVDGRIAPRQVEVVVSGGQVASLRDAADRKGLKAARLDPARIATLYGQKQEERRLVRISETPELLVTGLQAVEDKDFAHHHGIDISGIVRAVWVAVRSGGETRQGASTLTQQLARSGLLGIGKEQTLTRKFNEVLYALIMEARYDKATILEAYLNQVYLGQRGKQAIHGVASGAEFWFGRDLNSLTTEQVALLIGLVKGPSYYDPRRNPDNALDRRNFVLGKLHENKLIDDAEYQRALKAPLGVSKTPGIAAANRFPAYIDLVRRQLGNDYPESVLQGAGLNVFTGMSPSAQAYAEGAVQHTIKALENKRRPELQTGLVLTDVHNGDVLAVVGSRDVSEPGFNRAIEAQRPVGSLLKPFVYLLALAQPDRFSLATWVEDTPVTVNLSRGRNWTPGNADNRSHGTVRLIDALARSYNQATVRVGMQVGPERLTHLINVLAGLKAEANPAVILGSTDQSPYGMTQLYQFLASGGEIQPLHAVRGVVDAQGKLLKRYDKSPAPAQEGDSIAANLISVGLQQVVASGTAARLNAEGLSHLQAAGKTGTSNDGRDSWYAGYTGDHLAVIWMGNDQNEQTGLFGASGAMRVWSGIFRNLPSKPLRVNNKGLDWQYVDANGNNATDEGCPGARRFPFVVGFAPAYAPCSPPAEAVPDAGEGGSEGGGWRSWFGLDRKAPEPASTPASETPAR
ncbi:penicillin-binding protein 1B [Stenotrophomonas sp. ATCM1_4]|uniref:penicillin-binding protein 1B n=1 Tax=unclassified Stenotrophomonas TaxID=196198 RepID=UPI0010525936|nr:MULTISPECIES: penicillin-binding protein 1B [unclassified Stenotrophomonas]MBD9536331.1 penicillin-binding protein 1B [Stenotrophomonas sp. STM01]TDB28864.1 penicillin-binding protein 1B [Stenotrophomonas sp. ATCM1_4]